MVYAPFASDGQIRYGICDWSPAIITFAGRINWPKVDCAIGFGKLVKNIKYSWAHVHIP